MSHPQVHAGTDDGLHVFGTRRVTLFDGHEVTALARQGARWWAILDKREIWRSEAGGRWGKQARVASRRALCLAPTRAGVLVGTSEAHLLRLRLGGLEAVTSFDRTPGRGEWFTPWGGPPDTRSISIASGGEIYVNVHVGGVACSRDGGDTWAPTIEIAADVHQVVAHPGRPRWVFAAGAIGLGISHDAGKSWRFETRGFHATYQRAVAVSDRVVLVSTSKSERGQQAAVYRRSLAGTGAFKKCVRGLPEWFDNNVDTGCLAASGDHAVIGTHDGCLYVSSDHGLSWERLAKDLPRVRCVALAPGAKKPAERR